MTPEGSDRARGETSRRPHPLERRVGALIARARPVLQALWLAGWVAVMASLVTPVTAPGPAGFDKLLHFLVFFALTGAGLVIFSRTRPVILLGFLAASAAGTELAQLWVPGRSASILDLAADAAGILAGWVLARSLAGRLSSR